MALFEKSDLDSNNGTSFLSLEKEISKISFIRESAGISLKHSFPDYEENKLCVSFSKAKWSAHEMLAYFLQMVGPSDVWIASWSITEEPARKLISLMDGGHILNLSCLFGERLKVIAPGAYQLLKSRVKNLALARSHAKVIVIRNEDYGITVVSSANFSKNMRTEASAVVYCKETAESMSEQIEIEIRNGIK